MIFRASVILLFLVSFAFGALAAPTAYTEWPRWRGPHQMGWTHRSEIVPDTLPKAPKTVWRIRIGEGYSSPVVDKGKVAYTDHQDGKEVLHVVDAATGKEFWAEPIDDAFEDKQGPPGPRCTPAIDDDRVYAQSCKGELQCRSMADGKLIWRKNFVKDFGAEFIGETGDAQGAARHGNNASPTINDRRLIAMVGSKKDASVVCMDKLTGNVIWKAGKDEAGYAPAFITSITGRKQAIAFTAEGVMGVDFKKGGIYWNVPIKTRFARHVTTPVVARRDIVIVSSNQNGLYGIKVERDGKAFSAKELWVNKKAAINFSSPITDGQFVYGLGPAKNLICVDPTSGEIKWSKEGLIRTSANKAHAAFILLGRDKILALTDGGELVYFKASAEGFEQISRAQVCGENWCNPAYVGGKLYLRDGLRNRGNLYCIDLME